MFLTIIIVALIFIIYLLYNNYSYFDGYWELDPSYAQSMSLTSFTMAIIKSQCMIQIVNSNGELIYKNSEAIDLSIVPTLSLSKFEMTFEIDDLPFESTCNAIISVDKGTLTLSTDKVIAPLIKNHYWSNELKIHDNIIE